MTNKEILARIASVDDNETFEVTLKTEDVLLCVANPKKTKIEVVHRQTAQCETFEPGDILKPREIESIEL